ncbi:hypothetical protein FQR65_LT11991 [Abscondita terminalis]|nr:hypothetical protein FQR65_LT11991 [Abscondita terminalis]
MEWDNELVLQLIDEYEKFPILWDGKNKDHFCRNKKNDAWAKIASNLELEVFEVKQKINSLLGSFRREKAKGKRSVGAGKGSDGIYKSKWFAFAKMSFLLNKNEIQATVQTKVENFDQMQLYTQVENKDHDNVVHTVVPENLPTQILPSGPPKKKIKTVTGDLRSEEAYEVKNASLKPSADALSTYGQHIVNKLRTYTKTTQIEVEHAINSILYNADKGLYDRLLTQTSVNSFPTNYNVIDLMSPSSPSTSTPTASTHNTDMAD